MKKGFTLIELIVVMSIIGLLSSVLFLGRTKGEERLALQRSAYQLTQDLREIQGMAMGAGKVSCDGEYAYSFGVYFHQVEFPNSYVTFADCNGNKQRDVPGEDLREIKLEKGVIFYDISPSVPSAVVFTPPNPTIFINTKEWVDYECIVTLALESEPDNPVNQKKVKINSAGRIEIE